MYLDLEWVGIPGNSNPYNDKLITIQYQYLNPRTWEPRSRLRILKEWDYKVGGEKQILREFWNSINKNYSEIPKTTVIGQGIVYDKEILRIKLKRYKLFKNNITPWDFLNKWLYVDTRSMLVLLNNGIFKGSGLHNWTDKKMSGFNIHELYKQKKFEEIEEYIRVETNEFLKLLKNLKDKLRRIGRDMKKINNK